MIALAPYPIALLSLYINRSNRSNQLAVVLFILFYSLSFMVHGAFNEFEIIREKTYPELIFDLNLIIGLSFVATISALCKKSIMVLALVFTQGLMCFTDFLSILMYNPQPSAYLLLGSIEDAMIYSQWAGLLATKHGLDTIYIGFSSLARVVSSKVSATALYFLVRWFGMEGVQERKR